MRRITGGHCFHDKTGFHKSHTERDVGYDIYTHASPLQPSIFKELIMAEVAPKHGKDRRLFLRKAGLVAGTGCMSAVVTPAFARSKSSDTSSDVAVMQGALA